MKIEHVPDAPFPEIRKRRIEVLQCNLGRLCNQACRHCHIDASPARSAPHENAEPALFDDILELLRRNPSLTTLDVTGGAPELNPGFRELVLAARRLGRTVFVRHNLTVQSVPGQEDLPAWFARAGVVAFCSMPCYLEENVDRQRGDGVFDKSVAGLRRLNAVGYGRAGTGLELHLVFNPQGPSLPPAQEVLEADYRRELEARHGIVFTRLVTMTNQPIQRFRRDLERQDALVEYESSLRENFNERTLSGVMCRDMISMRWDGRLFDCDFNLALDLPLRDGEGRALGIGDLLAREEGVESLVEGRVAVDRHCYACTAGCGSSCGGALA